MLVVRRVARRRRWSRHLRHGALVAVMLAAGLTLFRQRRTVEEATLSVGEAPYLVHSRALPEGFVIRTQEKSVTVVTTSRMGVESFSTANLKPLERIDDETLLHLAPGAVLVRYQAGAAELIFPPPTAASFESRASHE